MKIWGALFLAALAVPVRAVDCPSSGGLPASPASYDQAVASFASYRASKQSGGTPDEALPFSILQGAKTAQSVLLVHGFGDSPYFVKPVGQFLASRGYNVVSVLLPGHGTHPECLLNVTADQWRQEVAFGLSVAKQLGDKVSMMGFSTGGALTLDAISGDAQVNWGNIFLFSPAIGLGGQLIHICENAPTAAMVQVFMPYTGGEKTPANDGLGEDHHYTSWASNGACQLNSIVRSNSNVRDLIGKRIADQHIGVFAVESMADTTVDPVAVVDFVDNLAGQTRTKLITYPKGNDNDPGTIKHNDVPRPVENESDGRHGNPRFDEMIRDLGAFLGPPSAGAAADAEKQAQTREADRISRNVNRVLGEEGLGL